MDQARTRRISEEVVALLGTGSQVTLFSQRYDGFDLEEAYCLVQKVRELRGARGETPIGSKIGFTNRAIWGALGISAPVWNFVFDRTVRDGSAADTIFKLFDLPEPRIDPTSSSDSNSQTAPVIPLWSRSTAAPCRWCDPTRSGKPASKKRCARI